MKKKIKYISLLLVFIVSLIIGLNNDKITVFADLLTFKGIIKNDLISGTYQALGDNTGYFVVYKDKEGKVIEVKYLNHYYGYGPNFDEFNFSDTCASINGTLAPVNQPCHEIYQTESKKISDIKNWYVEKAVGNIALDDYVEYGYAYLKKAYTYLEGTSYYSLINRWGYYFEYSNEAIAFSILFDDYKTFIETNNYDVDLTEVTTQEEAVDFYCIYQEYLGDEVYIDEFFTDYGEEKVQALIDKIAITTSGKEIRNEFEALLKEIQDSGLPNYTNPGDESNINDYYSISNYFYNYDEELYDYWDMEDRNTTMYVLKEVSDPTFTIDCEPTKIAKDETAVCTLKVNANQKITKIEGNISSEHLIVDSVEDQNGWKSTKDDSGKYTITHPDGISGESDVLKINISTNEDDDVQTKLVLSAIKYTDIAGNQEHADVSSNIDIVKIPPTGDYRITFMIVILVSVAAITILLIIQKNKRGFKY